MALDFDEMARQASQLQAGIAEAQDELRRRTFGGQSSDGTISVRVTGDLRVKKVAVDEERLSGLDAKTLQVLIREATNAALDGARQAAMERLGIATAVAGELQVRDIRAAERAADEQD